MDNRPLSSIRILSFGAKYGDAPPANICLDVRCLKNPHYEEDLRPLTGFDQPVQDFLLNQPGTRELLASVRGLLEIMLPGYLQHATRYVDTLTIAFGCTGGKHRSRFMVFMVEQMVREITNRLGVEAIIAVEHRDHAKE